MLPCVFEFQPEYADSHRDRDRNGNRDAHADADSDRDLSDGGRQMRLRVLRFLALLLVLFVLLIAATRASATTFTTDLAELPCGYNVHTFTPTGVNVLGGAGAAVVNGTPQTAPANTAVMADTGQLAPGCYVIAVYATNLTDTAPNGVLLAHRNAANGADLSTSGQIPVNVYNSGLPATGSGLFQVQIGAQNERVVARLYASATSAKIWQVDFALFPCK